MRTYLTHLPQQMGILIDSGGPQKALGSPMDDLDHRLISLLRANARTSIAALAKQLGVARGTVQNRMAKLEADGTIVGYTVRLKPDVAEQHIHRESTHVHGSTSPQLSRAGQPRGTSRIS